MYSYIKSYFIRYDFLEPLDDILRVAELVGKDDFIKASEIYSQGGDNFIEQLVALAKGISQRKGLNEYKVNAVIVLSLFGELEKRHADRGIPQEITFSTLEDAVFKMRECNEVFGVYGIMDITWYKAILEQRTFGIGRLQYELDYFRLDCYKSDDITLKKGDRVLSVHIPSSKRPFDKSARSDSYDRAVKFFKQFFPNEFPGAIPFVSWTWLLNPKNDIIMPTAKNIIDFKNEFEILESAEYKNNDSIAWRIFGVDRIVNVNDLKEDTSMRRSVKEYIAHGNKLGWGYGIFVKKIK